MDAFAKLPSAIAELVEEFSSTPVVGDLNAGLTQYSFWLLIAAVVMFAVFFAFTKKQKVVPEGFFVNGVEWVIEYVQDDIAKGVVGDNWKKHFPFLASLFFFILINNFIGLIPGMKPGTGAIGCTAALALVSFVYFLYFGIKCIEKELHYPGVFLQLKACRVINYKHGFASSPVTCIPYCSFKSCPAPNKT